MNCLTRAYIRVGTTGTLDDSQLNRLVLVGHFGEIKKVTTTKALMDTGKVAKLKIIALRLDYDEESRRAASKLSYEEELQFILSRRERHEKLIAFARSQEAVGKTTLMLFKRISHGKQIEKTAKRAMKDPENVFYVSGSVGGDERERIRLHVNKTKGCTLIASHGVYSAGVNIPNLHAAVFSHPFKAKIMNLQSIGRILRLPDDGSEAVLLDIIDDLSWKRRENYAIHHARERMKAYTEEGFEVVHASMKINGKHEQI